MGRCNSRIRAAVVCAAAAVLLAGCQSASPQQEKEEQSAAGLEEETLLPGAQELPEVYQQMLLYLQEGLYTHGIDGTYRVYFGDAEYEGDITSQSGAENRERQDSYFCEILLEGKEHLWMEKLAYSYDQDSGWYTFYGQYEPALAGEPAWAEFEDSDFVTNMRENGAFIQEVSGEMHFPYPRRYHAESGPVERDARIETCIHDRLDSVDAYSIWTMLYTYVDERLDTHITILYPEIQMAGVYEDAEMKKLQEVMNDQIRDAFFYSYGMDEGSLQPQEQMYGSIDRNYIITRMDEDYLSMRIYESNVFRRAAHPNEWETGITIDMHTGKVLQFRDVVGEDFDLDALIDSGAFRCRWFWENDTGEYWLEHFDRERDWDTHFYLTDESLGLITTESRYYTDIEADFEDLGIGGF